MQHNQENILNRSYKKVFLVQNRDFWRACPVDFDKNTDLVLTFDFGLVNQIVFEGGFSGYIDHIADKETLESYNYETYKFFENWHRDKEGKDIFTYKGFDFGDSFRIEIWNEMTYYPRMLLNFSALKKIRHIELIVGLKDDCVTELLSGLGIKAKYWYFNEKTKQEEYYFPVFRWFNERLYPSFKNTKAAAYWLISGILDIFYKVAGNLNPCKDKNKYVFIWQYHPTTKILQKLKEDKLVKIVSTGYSFRGNKMQQKRIPIIRLPFKHKRLAAKLINNFYAQKNTHWDIQGFRVSDVIYDKISKRIFKNLSYRLMIIDSIDNFFSRKDLRLIITVSNIGIINSLVMSYCFKKKIPSYLIINGLLASSYLDEAKKATWINSYGEAIKNNYFGPMKNVICLGDPRMDNYANTIKNNKINTNCPRIVIGAAGFNNIDLNSYLAYEFDFLNDIMLAFRHLIGQGKKMNVALKVRSNGYAAQYSNFLKEYFNDVAVTIYDDIPIKDVLMDTDFYISIYSQTLFEASCLGIPVLYYKKDTEIKHPPFDGNSELVTAFSPDDLIKKIDLFYSNDAIFNKFMEEKVMEKYIGPLDGKNTQRNMDFLYSLGLAKDKDK